MTLGRDDYGVGGQNGSQKHLEMHLNSTRKYILPAYSGNNDIGILPYELQEHMPHTNSTCFQIQCMLFI